MKRRRPLAVLASRARVGPAVLGLRSGFVLVVRARAPRRLAAWAASAASSAPPWPGELLAAWASDRGALAALVAFLGRLEIVPGRLELPAVVPAFLGILGRLAADRGRCWPGVLARQGGRGRPRLPGPGELLAAWASDRGALAALAAFMGRLEIVPGRLELLAAWASDRGRWPALLAVLGILGRLGGLLASATDRYYRHFVSSSWPS